MVEWDARAVARGKSDRWVSGTQKRGTRSKPINLLFELHRVSPRGGPDEQARQSQGLPGALPLTLPYTYYET
jgi:hypothetical protein